MTAKAPTALIMAGGTGGHVFPAMAVAERLEAQGCAIHWLGTAEKIEARVVPKAGIPLHCIQVQGLRGKGKLGMLSAPLRVAKAIWQARKVVKQVQPNVVLGMGGFASGPGAVAAKMAGIPLVIHEQNAVAGMTNKLSSRFASRVLAAFPGAFGVDQDKQLGVEILGNPVRGPILQLPEPQQRYAERSGPIRLLVVGGSLGARALNEGLPEALAKLPESKRPQVRHQTGASDLESTEQRYAELGVEAQVSAFIEHMDEAYGWADLVICRAGALTVSEIAIAGVAALFVPFPHAVDDHQTANAGYLEQLGAAQVVQQSEMSCERLVELLLAHSDRQQLLDMAIAARQAATPQATERVAEICLEKML